MSGQIDYKITMYPQRTPWISAPLPPVFAEAPFELEYADEEGSGSSDGLNHSDQGSSKYFEPRQVSVEERSLLRIIEDSPEPTGPSNRPHWGRGDLETSGNILGKFWALDHFSPNVSTNHILGTFRL